MAHLTDPEPAARSEASVFDVAGTRFGIGPGDSLNFIGTQPHHWTNEGDQPAELIWFELRGT